jgi:thiol-disulfide isomerase/thioredoxin
MKKSHIKGVLWSVFIASSLLGGARLWSQNQKSESITQFEVETIQGQKFSSQRLSQKPWIVHFWATWCAPCVVELPDLLKVASQVNQVEWLILSEDEKREDLYRFKEMNLAWPPQVYLLFDPEGKLSRRMGSYQYPETYLIDPKTSRILKKWVGSQNWSELLVQLQTL